MNVIPIVSYNWQHRVNANDCSQCIGKICCVVFDIFSWWSRIEKHGWVTCSHLSVNGDCSVYDSRHALPWFKHNCITYACNNIWPILSRWIVENGYSLVEDSIKIWYILEWLSEFVTRDERFGDRILFIEEYTLKNITSIDALYNWATWANSPQENEFYQRFGNMNKWKIECEVVCR